MPRSANSLYASGSISPNQMKKLQVLRGTRAQKSKMAPFEQKTKDEGHQRNKGIPQMRVNEINGPNQDGGGKYGTMSKGSRVNKGGQPKVGAIDDGSMQRPKFPAGGNVSSSNPKTGNTRMKGKIPAQGGQYGGGGRNTQ